MNEIRMRKTAIIGLLAMLLSVGCSSDDAITPGLIDPNEEKPEQEIESEDRVEGIRIAWDYQSLREISDADHHGYNGYARMIQLEDNSLLAVYESNGNVVVKKSHDLGSSWGSAIYVARFSEGVNMATPDLIQLHDNSILVSYNPRPTDNAASIKKFAIKTKKSYDGGITWRDDRLVYEGSNNFGDGVWEPSPVQLPSGEIQVFFSNENVYRNSAEQNISFMRSFDNGLSWTDTPEIASFTPGSRDGMPSPILLKNENEIVFSIEDNSGNGKFKPYTIRNTLSENWEKIVTENSPNRNYALKNPLDPSVNAAAPYLAQLNSGETLLSYQGTEGRWNNTSDMKVVIGNELAMDFDRKSVPFPVDDSNSAIWNSLAVLEDDTVIALTTTRAFSSSNGTKVWMIKGYVIPEVEVENSTLDIDGSTNESLWHEDFPVFIGNLGYTQLKSNFSYDEEYLYVINRVIDKNVRSSSPNLANNDAVTIYLDPQNKGFVSPGTGIFKIQVFANNAIVMHEGDTEHYSGWSTISTDELVKSTKVSPEGYLQELAIPWSLIGGKPNAHTRIGFNMELVEKGDANYTEGISSNKSDLPYTWTTMRLK